MDIADGSESLPTGKINTFANQTMPHALLICLREDRPVSLVTAYEKPIRSSSGYAEKSIDRLKSKYNAVTQWIPKPSVALNLELGDFPESCKEIKNYSKFSLLLDDLGNHLMERLPGERQ